MEFTAQPRVKPATPYGLPVLNDCLACVVAEERLFCQLSHGVLADLSDIRHSVTFPAGALLYVEGGQPTSLLILCAGRAKLNASARDGKTITLRDIFPGEVMGLSCVMSGRPYQSSAVTVEPSEVSCINASDFWAFLRRHNEAAIRVAEHLSMELHAAWAQTRMIALAPNARAKMAQLLLIWADRHGKATPEGSRFSINMTQEAVGEAIGATRETVSRLLGEFQRKNLIRVAGSSVTLLQPDELRGFAHTR